MSLYRVLYEDGTRREARPAGPRPKGLKLLWDILRREWWLLVKLNILFWLCCLPVVTIPAALKAMTRICVLLLRGEPRDLWNDWWIGFRSGFLRTAAVGGGMAALLFSVSTGLRFYGTAMAENGLLAVPAVLLLILLAVLVMSLFSLFPLMEFSELSTAALIRSSLLLVLVRLPQNMAVLLVLAVLTAAYLLAYPYSSFVLGAIALSLFWLIACFAAWPGLEKYVFHTIEQEK